MEFRKANLEAFQKKYGIKIGFMSIFTKAAAYALQDQPVVNAVIDENVSKIFPSFLLFAMVVLMIVNKEPNILDIVFMSFDFI